MQDSRSARRPSARRRSAPRARWPGRGGARSASDARRRPLGGSRAAIGDVGRGWARSGAARRRGRGGRTSTARVSVAGSHSSWRAWRRASNSAAGSSPGRMSCSGAEAVDQAVQLGTLSRFSGPGALDREPLGDAGQPLRSTDHRLVPLAPAVDVAALVPPLVPHRCAPSVCVRRPAAPKVRKRHHRNFGPDRSPIPRRGRRPVWSGGRGRPSPRGVSSPPPLWPGGPPSSPPPRPPPQGADGPTRLVLVPTLRVGTDLPTLRVVRPGNGRGAAEEA